MGSFDLSDEVIDFISTQEDNIGKYNFNLFRSKNLGIQESLFRALSSGVLSTISNFYFLESYDNFNFKRFSKIYVEGIKNSLQHGSLDSPFVTYSLFLGDRGLCHGFWDSGNYFKSTDVKNLWENKIPIKSTKKNPSGLGNPMIYNASDLIFVNAEKGILYCAQSHENLKIEPGELFYYFLKK